MSFPPGSEADIQDSINDICELMRAADNDERPMTPEEIHGALSQLMHICAFQQDAIAELEAQRNKKKSIWRLFGRS